MKTIKTLSILFLSLITFIACNDNDLNVDNADGNLSGGGLLDVKNTSINYVVGNPGPYNVNIRVFQGEAKTTSIRVAKTFYSTKLVYNEETEKDDKVVIVSNTIDNFKTITVSDTDQNSMVSYSFDFSELVDGLSIEGSTLPTSDTEYLVGDYWEIEYFSTNSNGEYQNYTSTKAAVSTRYAGTYAVLQGDYTRIGVPYVNYFNETVVIESIDAEIYKHNGIAAWDDNTFYFTVDPDTGAITILETDPDGVDVKLNGGAIITCDNFTFLNQPCEGSDIAINNDETGEDVLKLTVGYYTASGDENEGPREFYEVLEKIVD